METIDEKGKEVKTEHSQFDLQDLCDLGAVAGILAILIAKKIIQKDDFIDVVPPNTIGINGSWTMALCPNKPPEEVRFSLTASEKFFMSAASWAAQNGFDGYEEEGGFTVEGFIAMVNHIISHRSSRSILRVAA